MKTIKRYWLSTRKATGYVEAENDIITVTPPIWRKFKSQYIWNLINWLKHLDKNTIIVEYKNG
jgi:hypothetical protein